MTHSEDEVLNTFTIPERTRALIDGHDVPGHGIDLPVHYPGSGAQVSVLEEAASGDVDAAVSSARRAFDSGPWPRMSVEARQELFRTFKATIVAHSEELAFLECMNTGLPLRELKSRHMLRAAYNFEFFAEYIGQARSDAYTQTPNYLSYVKREPVGVAALVGPWNAPVALASMKIAAALAFGNTAVVKPSEQTPLALFRLVELLYEAGLPQGVLNLVNGRGPVTGDALVKHSDIDLISFTGGTETGRTIMSAAGSNLVPCTMELGGKSANIVFASADQERALDGALLGIFSNNGQQCLAGSRILVEASIADEFIEKFVTRAAAINVGDPLDERTELGPLGSLAHLERVLSFTRTAKSDGAKLLTGGCRSAHLPKELANGYFMEPTAVLAPSNSANIAQREIFGPFGTFITFNSLAEAINIANDTQFGLVSYVWSDHYPTVMAATEGLRSGVVWVNSPMMRELRAPFGGFKDSGVGREGGAACEQFYTEEKTVSLPLSPVPLRQLGQQPGSLPRGS